MLSLTRFIHKPEKKLFFVYYLLDNHMLDCRALALLPKYLISIFRTAQQPIVIVMAWRVRLGALGLPELQAKRVRLTINLNWIVLIQTETGQPGDIGPDGFPGRRGDDGDIGEYGEIGDKGARVSCIKLVLLIHQQLNF